MWFRPFLLIRRSNPDSVIAFSFTRFLDQHNYASLSVGLLWTVDWTLAHTSTLQHTTFSTSIHAPGGIRTHSLSRRAAADLLLRPLGHLIDLLISGLPQIRSSIFCVWLMICASIIWITGILHLLIIACLLAAGRHLWYYWRHHSRRIISLRCVFMFRTTDSSHLIQFQQCFNCHAVF